MNTKDRISAHEMCRRAGITYRQLDYWVRTGIVEPARAADGSGSRREFDVEQVRVVIALAQVALTVGIERARAGIAAMLAELPDDGWSGGLVIEKRGALKVVLDLGEIDEMAWMASG